MSVMGMCVWDVGGGVGGGVLQGVAVAGLPEAVTEIDMPVLRDACAVK